MRTKNDLENFKPIEIIRQQVTDWIYNITYEDPSKNQYFFMVTITIQGTIQINQTNIHRAPEPQPLPEKEPEPELPEEQ